MSLGGFRGRLFMQWIARKNSSIPPLFGIWCLRFVIFISWHHFQFTVHFSCPVAGTIRQFTSLFLLPILIALPAIPENLAADTADNSDFFRPELHAGKKMTQVVHEVVRIIRVDKADVDQHIL